MNGLASIPSHAYYRLNTNTLPNTGDSRALGLIQGGGVRKTRNRRHRRRANKSKGKHKNKNVGGANSNSRTRTRRHKKTPSSNVNYAGRQIGHQSQRQSQRQRSQSGGFRSDANLIVSSLGNLLDSGVSTFRGTEVGANPIPFSDTLYERNL